MKRNEPDSGREDAQRQPMPTASGLLFTKNKQGVMRAVENFDAISSLRGTIDDSNSTLVHSGTDSEQEPNVPSTSEQQPPSSEELLESFKTLAQMVEGGPLEDDSLFSEARGQLMEFLLADPEYIKMRLDVGLPGERQRSAVYAITMAQDLSRDRPILV